MSRWSRVALRIYSAFLILAKIGIIAVILLAVFSFASGGVVLEGVGHPFIDFNGKEAIVYVPITIKNYGFYSINNISVSYTLKNSTTMLLKDSQIIGNINTSSIDTFTVPVRINMVKMYEDEYPELYHFTHEDTLYANITISLQYMLNWVHISVNTLYKFKWVPPIKDVKIYNPTNITMTPGGSLEFKIPYLLKTASYLTGNANICGKIIMDEENCGNFSGNPRLGESHRGLINMRIVKDSAKTLLTKSKHLKLVGNITLFGFKVPFTEKYYWGAPLSNLTYKLLPNETFYYSFTDESPFSLSMKVTKIFYYQGSEVKSSSSRFYVAPNQHIEKYEKIQITQPVDRIKIIFYDEKTSITYQEVIHL